MNHKLLIVALGLATAQLASATLLFNASTPADNAATLAAFRAAAGITSPQFFEDFESYTVGTPMNGVTVTGGMTLFNSATDTMEIRGPGAFGGSNPIGQRGLFKREAPWLVMDFSSGPALYVGAYDIDSGGAPVRVTYSDNSTQTFNLETTGAAGDSAEFFGFVAENNLLITKVEVDGSGSSGWGLDNIEYGVVPEPATLSVLGVLAIAALRRKKK